MRNSKQWRPSGVTSMTAGHMQLHVKIDHRYMLIARRATTHVLVEDQVRRTQPRTGLHALADPRQTFRVMWSACVLSIFHSVPTAVGKPASRNGLAM